MKLAVAIAALAALASPVLADASGSPATAPAPAVHAVQPSAIMGPALHVTDMARSLRFYTEGLGMTLNMKMGPEKRREYMIGFGADPAKPQIILLHDDSVTTSAAIAHGSGFDRMVMRIDDMDALARRLDALGFRHSEIRSVAMGYRMMTTADPDGYQYELVQRSIQH